MHRVWWTLACVGWLIVSGSPAVHAHDTTADQAITIYLVPEETALRVLMRLPAIVAGNTNLPTLADGHIDVNRIAPAVQTIGSTIAASLELRQGETPLPSPRVEGVISPLTDGSFASAEAARTHIGGGQPAFERPVFWQDTYVDLSLTYPAVGNNLSARIAPYPTTAGIIPVLAHYVAAPGSVRTFRLDAEPQRVTFDPTTAAVARWFAASGARTLVAGSLAALFLLALLSLKDHRRDGVAAVGALLAGEFAAMAIWFAIRPDVPALVLAASLVAASAAVLLACRNMATSSAHGLRGLALTFGVAHGLWLGDSLAGFSPFAGDHPVVAFVCFALVVALGQGLSAAVMATAAALLYRLHLPERAGAIGAALITAHTGMHTVMQEAPLMAVSSSGWLHRGPVLILVGWVLALIVFNRRQGRLADAAVRGHRDPGRR